MKDKVYVKLFDDWNIEKQLIDNKQPLNFNAREVWWCSVGVNVGYEIDGKGNNFQRPMLVYRKVAVNQCLCFPITKNIKNLPGYFRFKGSVIDGSIIFEQIKTVDSKRMINRIEIIGEDEFRVIDNAFLEYLNNSSPS